jgi:hypothetical protein
VNQNELAECYLAIKDNYVEELENYFVLAERYFQTPDNQELNDELLIKKVVVMSLNLRVKELGLELFKLVSTEH